MSYPQIFYPFTRTRVLQDRRKKKQLRSVMKEEFKVAKDLA